MNADMREEYFFMELDAFGALIQQEVSEGKRN